MIVPPVDDVLRWAANAAKELAAGHAVDVVRRSAISDGVVVWLEAAMTRQQLIGIAINLHLSIPYSFHVVSRPPITRPVDALGATRTNPSAQAQAPIRIAPLQPKRMKAKQAAKDGSDHS
jgi:hypothetical protein